MPSDSNRSRNFPGDTRGVMWTIQSWAALMVLFAALLVTAQVAPAPQAQRAESFSEFQLKQDVSDYLDLASGGGELSEAVLYWDARPGQQTWIDSAGGPSSNYYTTVSSVSDHPLQVLTQQTFQEEDIGYNIYVSYQDDTDGDGKFDETVRRRLAYQGSPGGDAVQVSKTVILKDGQSPRIPGTSSDGDGCTLEEMGDSESSGANGCSSSAYFAPDASPSSDQYNVLKIVIVAWKV